MINANEFRGQKRLKKGGKGKKAKRSGKRKWEKKAAETRLFPGYGAPRLSLRAAIKKIMIQKMEFFRREKGEKK